MRSRVSRTNLGPIPLAVVLVLGGCSADLVGPPHAGSGTSGSAGAGTSGTSGSSGTGGAGQGGSAGDSGGPTGGYGAGVGECEGTEVVTSKRLIRLTFNQQVNSLRTLFDPTIATKVAVDLDLPDATERTFPPLANTREGSVVTDTVWQIGDNLSRLAGEHVRDNFATLTGCGAAPTDTCAQGYLTTLAAKAYRRALSPVESERLLRVYTESQAAGGTIQEATQHGVYAILESPHFLYRTEFGAEGSAVEGRLAPHELASLIAYFVTDGPPDEALLVAAAAGTLYDPAGLRTEIDRLLEMPGSRQNLEQAMFAYFAIPALDAVVIDPLRAPDFDDGLRNSMYRESQLFINNALWNGQLTGLVTSRGSFINDRLAELYGVANFPAGLTLDAQGFGAVTLPETRAGILTQAGFLTAKARTDVPSVVGRGLLVNQVILCGDNPSFPEDRSDEIEEIDQMQEGWSERQKADARAMSTDCGGCHLAFDAFGLALETYDIIGKYRTVDEQNRPIDPSVMLPESAQARADLDGNGTLDVVTDVNGDGVFEPAADLNADGIPDTVVVANAVEMANQIAASGAFATCMARHLIAYALAEGGTTTKNCATRAVADRFHALPPAERTFSALIREVAVSNALAYRARGR